MEKYPTINSYKRKLNNRNQLLIPKITINPRYNITTYNNKIYSKRNNNNKTLNKIVKRSETLKKFLEVKEEYIENKGKPTQRINFGKYSVTQLLLDNKKLVKISKDLQKKQDEQKELLNQMALQNNQQSYIPNNNSLNENIENNDTILRSNKLNPNKRFLSNSNIYKNNNYNNEPIINEGYIQEPNYIKSNKNDIK